jgi:ABC-type nitrate/sulfonate/bicarbonate transport system substrate-binding protein
VLRFGRMLLTFALALIASPALGASRDVKVLVPDGDNLQYMSFWVAKAAGYFEEEGLAVTITVPAAPQETRALFERGEANVAVLPPPVYLELIAAKFPLVLVCNLLKNDPINIVVSERVWNERKLSREMPLEARLRALSGVRLGVAPNPPSRLRALFAAYGLNADRDVQMTILHGRDQNGAFSRGEVDALFAHTPYLEKALVDDGGRLLVHLSNGEAPALAMRQVHALVFARQLAEGSPTTALAMARAIARAQALLHSEQGRAAEALIREFPGREPRHVRTIVELYAPAIPDTPEVTSAGLEPALALFPASRPAPSLAGLDLNAYVAPTFAREASQPASRWGVRGWLLFGVAAGAIAFGLVRRRRRSASV